MQTRGLTNQLVRALRYAHTLFGGIAVGALVVILVSHFGLTIFKVSGQSMEPTLRDQQSVLVCAACARLSKPSVGDMVVISHAVDRTFYVVKRIAAAPGDSAQLTGYSHVLGPQDYMVLGDNPEYSLDSRTFGSIHEQQIVGVVIWPR
jgi:signal peptidase I